MQLSQSGMTENWYTSSLSSKGREKKPGFVVSVIAIEQKRELTESNRTLRRKSAVAVLSFEACGE